MQSLTEKVRTWSADETVRGLLPWVTILFVLFVVNQRYTVVQSSFTKTVEGLETRELYLRDRTSKICVGDMVRYRSTERRSRYFKKVAADAGAVLTLTDTGYRIDETDHPMHADWLAIAREQQGDRKALTVPEGEVLFVNPEFERGIESSNWAFETVPRGDITDRVTYVLFSRDFSRIGEKVGTADPDCIR